MFALKKLNSRKMFKQLLKNNKFTEVQIKIVENKSEFERLTVVIFRNN